MSVRIPKAAMATATPVAATVASPVVLPPSPDKSAKPAGTSSGPNIVKALEGGEDGTWFALVAWSEWTTRDGEKVPAHDRLAIFRSVNHVRRSVIETNGGDVILRDKVQTRMIHVSDLRTILKNAPILKRFGILN